MNDPAGSPASSSSCAWNTAALDGAIARLADVPGSDELQLKRLKKRKLRA